MTPPRNDESRPAPGGPLPVGASPEGRLRWNLLFGIASYLKSALWTVPLLSIAVVFAITPALRALDEWIQWPGIKN